MRALQTTLFVLTLLVLTTQTFRHVYVKWFEPTGSVLDRFRKPVEHDIAESRDLDDLVRRYEEARARKKGFERGKTLEELELARRTDRAEAVDEDELEGAIRRLEEEERDLFRLWFYWCCGLGSVLLGLLTYARVNVWLGMAGLITGFVEMAVWTSPLWRTWGPQRRFDELLTTKLILSFVSLALLITLWLWNARRERRTPGGVA